MEDEAILELFFRRSEAAISQLNRKYGSTCRKIVFGILNNDQDTEECMDDTYLKLWNSIPPQRPQALGAYVYRAARNCAISRYRVNTARKRSSAFDLAFEEMDECLADTTGVEEILEAQLMKQMIERFLDTLKPDDRTLFVRRYWFCDSCAQLAERMGISEKNVTVRLTRLRKRLKTHLIHQGVIE